MDEKVVQVISKWNNILGLNIVSID